MPPCGFRRRATSSGKRLIPGWTSCADRRPTGSRPSDNARGTGSALSTTGAPTATSEPSPSTSAEATDSPLAGALLTADEVGGDYQEIPGFSDLASQGLGNLDPIDTSAEGTTVEPAECAESIETIDVKALEGSVLTGFAPGGSPESGEILLEAIAPSGGEALLAKAATFATNCSELTITSPEGDGSVSTTAFDTPDLGGESVGLAQLVRFQLESGGATADVTIGVMQVIVSDGDRVLSVAKTGQVTDPTAPPSQEAVDELNTLAQKAYEKLLAID